LGAGKLKESKPIIRFEGHCFKKISIQLIFGESYESTYVSAIFEEPKDLFCSEYILLANMSIKKFVLSLW
jgi:hypothetical protein